MLFAIAVYGLVFILWKFCSQRMPRTFGVTCLAASLVLLVSGSFFANSSSKPVGWAAEQDFGKLAIVFYSALMAVLGGLYTLLGARYNLFLNWLNHSEHGALLKWVLLIACGLLYFAVTFPVMFWMLRLI